ncbi:hypothetical protein BJF83_09950 [Nocardiopsis sp. CNR-923]|uniref:hypothetical protein n=1 Tax=Nocardiopsis sp. CNR-923 TaxID=1904965 RepID=UPI00096890BD|nr:hypothetical protein [Nocardiopsis sp. CNR-923]OLT29707.1 hypothetical protein BJF83_09950 [Nocardiopsis sp. CNR-923]
MADTTEAEEHVQHHIITVHIWRTAEHVDRYQALRSLCLTDKIRAAVVTHLTNEIEGIGEIDGVWLAEVR